MYISHRVLVECGGKPPRCTLQTRPCCSLSPWAHTHCLSAVDPPQHWSLSLHPYAAMLWQHWEIWCRPMRLQLPLLVAGIRQRSAKPGPSPEGDASTKTAGHKRVSFECQLLELVGLWGRQKDRKTQVPLIWHLQWSPISLLKGSRHIIRWEPTTYELQAVDELDLFGCV